jgi:hypothetical protein
VTETAPYFSFARTAAAHHQRIGELLYTRTRSCWYFNLAQSTAALLHSRSVLKALIRLT